MKLTQEIKDAIISESETVKREILAVKYGVSYATISNVLKGRPRRTVSTNMPHRVLRIGKLTKRAYRYVDKHLGRIDALSGTPMTAATLASCGIDLDRLYDLASLLVRKAQPQYLVLCDSPMVITPNVGVKKLTWIELYVMQAMEEVPDEPIEQHLAQLLEGI